MNSAGGGEPSPGGGSSQRFDQDIQWLGTLDDKQRQEESFPLGGLTSDSHRATTLKQLRHLKGRGCSSSGLIYRLMTRETVNSADGSSTTAGNQSLIRWSRKCLAFDLQRHSRTRWRRIHFNEVKSHSTKRSKGF